ncbi:unnamed protein product [Schistocephalus solidus]|uniref:Amidase domain-containing protein n=1 Tax=Schistocephalus solidus TaxID=70667 RepID=A0A183T0K2_SCHSO|nr:unnamed protein product [Schistocephalus solidus]
MPDDMTTIMSDIIKGVENQVVDAGATDVNILEQHDYAARVVYYAEQLCDRIPLPTSAQNLPRAVGNPASILAAPSVTFADIQKVSFGPVSVPYDFNRTTPAHPSVAAFSTFRVPQNGPLRIEYADGAPDWPPAVVAIATCGVKEVAKHNAKLISEMCPQQKEDLIVQFDST